MAHTYPILCLKSMRDAYIFCRMDGDRTANLLGALALTLTDAIQAAAERQAPEPGAAAAAIALLRHDPGMTIERLRRALGLSHPGAVRLVDRLERAGAVERRASTGDRRAVALYLTPDGERRVPAVLGGRRQEIEAVLAILAPEEQAILGTLLEKMLRGLVRDVDHAYSVCRLCDDLACTACPVEAALAAPASRPRA
jgi:DNA-binding MarR family transcriptional regulator